MAFDNVLFDPGGACLFDDAMLFLKSFRPIELTLVASGDKGTQLAKIKALGLEPYFHAIHVANRKVGVIDPRDTSQAFFIANSPREIRAVKEECRWVFCIQVRNPINPEEQLYGVDKDDAYFSSLAPVAKFIKTPRPV